MKSIECLYFDIDMNMTIYLMLKASIRRHELITLVKQLWHETSNLSKLKFCKDLLLRRQDQHAYSNGYSAL